MRAAAGEAGIPDEVAFRTEPELARTMLGRALEAGVPACWVTGDEVYGNDHRLRRWLEARQQPFVLAITATKLFRRTDWASLRQEPAVALAAALPARAWRLLIRQSLTEPADRAYYLVFAPAGTQLAEAARVVLHWSWWRRRHQARAR